MLVKCIRTDACPDWSITQGQKYEVDEKLAAKMIEEGCAESLGQALTEQSEPEAKTNTQKKKVEKAVKE